MVEKSHVSMEQQICIVCCKAFDTDAILFDRRLRKSLKRKTITGYGMCPEHQQKRAEGYVAMIECDPTKTKHDGTTVKNIEDAYRTGTVVHIRRQAFEKLFNVPIPEKMVCFIEPDVTTMLQKMLKLEDTSDGNTGNG